MSKYYFEIPVNDADDNYAYSYDTIVAEGDSLQELLQNALVRVVDKYGQTVDIVPADASWMQLLVQQEYALAKHKLPKKLRLAH